MRPRWLVLLAGAAGCGVLSGLDQLKVGDAGDAGEADAVSDVVSLDVGSSCEAGACGAPSGFQPILFATGAAQTCPANTTSFDVIVDPKVPPSACTCTCSLQPVCTPQTLVYGSQQACSTKTISSVVLDGGCNKGNNLAAPAQMSVTPFPPTNTCTSTTVTSGTPVETQGHICGLSDCSACSAPPGYQVCYAQAGDVPCPPQMTPHTIGGSSALECSTCTPCSSTAKCKGTIQIYNDFQCGSNPDAITVDGTCQTTTAFALGTLQYVPSVDQGICTGGTSTATVKVSSQTTVCCP